MYDIPQKAQKFIHTTKVDKTEVHAHKINSHEINSHQINFPWSQLSPDQFPTRSTLNKICSWNVTGSELMWGQELYHLSNNQCHMSIIKIELVNLFFFFFHGPRTINYVEGWHSRQKKIANIFEIINVMQKKWPIWNSWVRRSSLSKKEICACRRVSSHTIRNIPERIVHLSWKVSSS